MNIIILKTLKIYYLLSKKMIKFIYSVIRIVNNNLLK